MERFESLQELERVEGAHDAAEVAEPVGPARGDVARFSKLFAKFDAVIKRVRFGKLREFARGDPIKLSTVDDHAADAGAVSASEFGGAVDCDVDAVFKRAKHYGREDRVVAEDRDAGGMGDVGDRLVIEHVVLWVGERFDINRFGFRADGLRDVLRIGRVDERDVNAETFHGLAEEGDSPSVKRGGRDDMTAGMGQVEDRHGDGLLPAGESDGSDSAFECGHASFEDVGRRVAESCIDPAWFFQVKEIGCVVGAGKVVAGRLINRDGAGAGRGVDVIAGMDCKCPQPGFFKRRFFFFHRVFAAFYVSFQFMAYGILWKLVSLKKSRLLCKRYVVAFFQPLAQQAALS